MSQQPEEKIDTPHKQIIQKIGQSESQLKRSQPYQLRNHTSTQKKQKKIDEDPVEQQKNESESENNNESQQFSKSQKSNPNQQKQSEQKSNEDRKGETVGNRKCFNKQCNSKKQFRKIRSRVQSNKYRYFCNSCYQKYSNFSYCQFCEQIYSSNEQNDDDDKWIGCDTCDRWNHLECEKKYRDYNVSSVKDSLYQCLVCSKKSKSLNQEKIKPAKFQKEEQKTKLKFQINKDERISIFHKKVQSLPSLEYFLQNYGFRLWLSQNLIREDLQTLRNATIKSHGGGEEGRQKKKIRIQ